MKKMLICFLLIVWGSVVSSAQEVKKELQTEKDGYKWYKTSQGSFKGAESFEGKTIIPLSKKYEMVRYNSPYFCGLYYSNKPGLTFKKEFYTKDGKEILDNSRYDETNLLGGEDGVPFWFRTQKDGKKGACDINGNEIVPPIFEECFYSYGEFNVKDSKGYHKWSEYKSQVSNSYASNNTSTNATSNTSSNTSSVKALFDQAYNTPDTEAQTKYDRYMQVIRADPHNTYGYKALAYNNIGVLYESLGDLKNAKTYFEYAIQANPNYGQAKANLKSVKAQRRSQRWSNVIGVLGAIGEAAGTIGGSQTGGTYNAYQGSEGSSYSGSSSGSSTSGQNCVSCSGSGKCTVQGFADKYRCHGSGKCQHCNSSGTQRAYGNTMVCPTCNGTKKCHYCSGSGRCPTCGGSGKK